MSILESPQIHADHRFMSSANPDAEGANFRLAMREFASGVTIIACGEGEARAGCTATAVASLSVSPPSLIVCLSLAAATLQSLRRRRRLLGQRARRRTRRARRALRRPRRRQGRRPLRSRRLGRRSSPARPCSPTRSPRWIAWSRTSSSATPTPSSSAPCRRCARAARNPRCCIGAAGSNRCDERQRAVRPASAAKTAPRLARLAARAGDHRQGDATIPSASCRARSANGRAAMATRPR